MTDLVAHLTRQAAFGRATFGPGPRTEGVLKHIETEIEEVRKADAAEDLDELVKEWTDIAILGLDGLIRAVREHLESLPIKDRDGKLVMRDASHKPIPHDVVARIAVENIVAKQGKNELRNWPDWRLMSADQPIEHDRANGVQ
ncbi:MazG-like nucleotide pyrophosphohydrolase [Rhodobacter phage RcCWillis]|nr:MazG-like nucleotide pyrophosphohydrolase [Rhodobacter phage RcCWillis]